MSTAAQAAERSAEIARILETESDLKAFQQHLEEVLCGEAFRGSHRSVQFLRYVINQSVSGHCDELKERLIGIELFGRPPSYDTGEDAIVRVTASDVRRRLLQHYGTCGTSSEFRIRLPLGAYIPEITRDLSVKTEVEDRASPPPPDSLAPSASKARGHEAAVRKQVPPISQTQKQWIMQIVLLCCLGIAIYGILALWLTTRSAPARTDWQWGMLFDSQLGTKLITSDPNIVELQTLTGQTVTLSDYANRRYVPDPSKVTPQLMKFSTQILRGANAAA